MDSRHRRSFSAYEVEKKNPNGVVEEQAESASVAGSENGAVSSDGAWKARRVKTLMRDDYDGFSEDVNTSDEERKTKKKMAEEDLKKAVLNFCHVGKLAEKEIMDTGLVLCNGTSTNGHITFMDMADVFLKFIDSGRLADSALDTDVELDVSNLQKYANAYTKYVKAVKNYADALQEYASPSDKARLGRDIARYTDETKRKEEREDANDGLSYLSASSLPLSESDEAYPSSPYISIGIVWNAMTEKGTPLAPFKVTVTEITSDSALISWNQNPQDPRSVLRWKLTYYRDGLNIYSRPWSRHQLDQSLLLAFSTPELHMSYRLSGLQSSKDYVVRIQGINQYGIGEYSKTTFSTTFKKETKREGKLCGERNSVDYVGTKNVTKSGFKCQNWDSDEYHVRSKFTKKLVEKKQQMNGVLYLEKNYCRNPSQNWGGTWCYTTNPNKRWENCVVPKCSEEEETRYKPCKSHTDCSKGYDDHKGYVCTWLEGAGKDKRSICTIGVKGWNFYGKN